MCIRDRANLCRLADDYETAELLCLQFIRAFGEDAPTLNILSIICNATCRRPQALCYSKQAVSLVPENPIYAGNLGCYLADTGRNKEAEAVLRRALAIREDLVYVHEHLGCLLKHMGRLDEAGAEFRRGVELLHYSATTAPPDRDSLCGLTRLFRHLGEQDKADDFAERYRLARETEDRGGDERFVIATYRSEAQ